MQLFADGLLFSPCGLSTSPQWLASWTATTCITDAQPCFVLSLMCRCVFAWAGIAHTPPCPHAPRDGMRQSRLTFAVCQVHEEEVQGLQSQLCQLETQKVTDDKALRTLEVDLESACTQAALTEKKASTVQEQSASLEKQCSKLQQELSSMTNVMADAKASSTKALQVSILALKGYFIQIYDLAVSVSPNDGHAALCCVSRSVFSGWGAQSKPA